MKIFLLSFSLVNWSKSNANDDENPTLCSPAAYRHTDTPRHPEPSSGVRVVSAELNAFAKIIEKNVIFVNREFSQFFLNIFK